MDKIREAGLTLAEPEAVSVPAIRDFPLTLECKVIYRQEQNASQLPEAIRKQFYSVDSGDHISYYGEIMDAYVIEEEHIHSFYHQQCPVGRGVGDGCLLCVYGQ